MNNLTRRQFLKASGMTGGLALAGGVVTLTDLHARARYDPLPQGAKVLVLVTLYGGNDGLGTVVPHADPAYHGARPDLAYSASEVLRLDDELGLNPAMTGLHALWENKQLAIVRGVGYPKPDHSHFRSMDIWQTAAPAAPTSTGWIGRWLDASGRDPLKAVSIGSVLPPLAVGAHSTAAALPLGRPLRPELVDALEALSGDDNAVARSYAAERRVASTFGHVLEDETGDESLADQLALVGRCIKAGVPTRVWSVSLSGFDTHADEKGTQSALLGQLDRAVSAFLKDMAADPHGRDVVLVTYSEFGRRVAANASDGTDHGTAGPMLVAGVPVRGGFYGDQPSLTDLVVGDLKVTTDFRDVYAELVDRVLGGDPQQVLGTGGRGIGFLT